MSGETASLQAKQESKRSDFRKKVPTTETQKVVDRIRNLFGRNALQEIAKTVPGRPGGDLLGRAKYAYEQEADKWEQTHGLSKQSQREKRALDEARQKAVAENFKKIEKMANQGKHLRTGPDGQIAKKLVMDTFGDERTAREWAKNILTTYYKKDSEGNVGIGPGGLPELADGKKPDRAYWLATHIQTILGPEKKSSPPETKSSSGKAETETPKEAPKPEASTSQSASAPTTEALAANSSKQSGIETKAESTEKDTADVEAAGDQPQETKQETNKEESNPIKKFLDQEKELLDDLIERLGDDPQTILKQLKDSNLSPDEKQDLMRRIQRRINDRLGLSEQQQQQEEEEDTSEQTDSPVKESFENSIKKLIQESTLDDKKKDKLLKMLEERKKRYDTFKNHPTWDKLELAFFALEIAIMILEMAKQEAPATH